MEIGNHCINQFKIKTRSNKNISAQLIDDVNGKTIVQTSSRDKSIADLKLKSNIEISFICVVPWLTIQC